jgi:hypothetical protein
MNSKRELGVYSILLLKQMNYLHIFSFLKSSTNLYTRSWLMKHYAKVNVSSTIPNAPVNQMGFFVTGDGYFHSDPIGNRLSTRMAFEGQSRTYK